MPEAVEPRRRLSGELRAEFTLTARNSGGDPCHNKRDQITVEAKDKDGQNIVTGVFIQDFEDGTYKISYFPKKAGELQVSVKVIKLEELNIEFQPRQCYKLLPFHLLMNIFDYVKPNSEKPLKLYYMLTIWGMRKL